MNLAKKHFQKGYLRLPTIPVLVWLGAVAVVIFMFTQRGQQFETVGIVENHTYQVAPEVTGKIANVATDLYEPVSQGQPIVEFSSEHIDAELAVIEAEIDSLRSELVPTAQRMLAESADRKSDWIGTNRRFAVDVESTRLTIMNLKTEIAVDRIRLQDLELEVKIAEDLLEKDAISEYELQKAQAAYEIVETKIEENERNLVQAENDLEQAMQRRDIFVDHEPYVQPVDSLLETIHKNITVQEKRINELIVEKNRLTLFAPGDGIINEVFAMAGETVQSGEPVLSITSGNPSRIIVYARQGQFNHITEGSEVELATKNDPGQLFSSRVVKTGSEVVQLPEQLWFEPGNPEWGRPILIEVPTGLEVVPGELVMVQRL